MTQQECITADSPTKAKPSKLMENALELSENLGKDILEIKDGRILYHIKDVVCIGYHIGDYTVDIVPHPAGGSRPRAWRDDGKEFKQGYRKSCHPRIYCDCAVLHTTVCLYSTSCAAYCRAIDSGNILLAMDIIHAVINRRVIDEGSGHSFGTMEEKEFMAIVVSEMVRCPICNDTTLRDYTCVACGRKCCRACARGYPAKCVVCSTKL